MLKRATPLCLLVALMCATATAAELSEREQTYVRAMGKYLKLVDARITRIGKSTSVEHLSDKERNELSAHLSVSKQRIEWMTKAIIHVGSGRVEDIVKIEDATKDMVVELDASLTRIQQLLEQ